MLGPVGKAPLRRIRRRFGAVGTSTPIHVTLIFTPRNPPDLRLMVAKMQRIDQNLYGDNEINNSAR